MTTRKYRAIVMGASVGGMEAVTAVLSSLPVDFALPVLVVQHLHASDRGAFARQMDKRIALHVLTARDKGKIEAGHVYYAPANYHLLVEQDETLALSLEEPVNWSRPSVDVLFESAARVWGEHLVGVILSGSQHDGAAGLLSIAGHGGLTIVEDPVTAHNPGMPRAALKAAPVDYLLPLLEIRDLLSSLCPENGRRDGSSEPFRKENHL